jgi:hypothetical protein
MIGPFRIKRPDEGVRLVARGGEAKFDFYLDRLLKMIPGEVIGLYLVGSGFIPQDRPTVLALWAVVCLVGVILLRAYATTDQPNGKPPQWGPVAISAVAFVIWVYTLGGPFAAFGLFVPYIGSLFVLAWTFFIPVLYKGPLES